MNKKRWIIIILMGMMAFDLIGCAKKEAAPQKEEVGTQTELKKISLSKI